MTRDVVIIGGGIVGLATARALISAEPSLDLLVLEKEPAVATHQSGRNSGVIHSGIYYAPGSLKARLCVRGAAQMVEFCRQHAIPFTRDGKVVVATTPEERIRLDELERRGRANGLTGLRRIGREELREFEPHAAGSDGLFVPQTGAVDFGDVAGALAADVRSRGAEVLTNAAVTEASSGPTHWRLAHSEGDVTARMVVNCAGLYSDRVAALMGVDPPVRIVPFRGEYWSVRPSAGHLVRSSIYPVPDPDLPFLGVHLTKRADGTVEAGPNAVLALAREGYRRSAVRPGDVWDTLSYGGMYRLARRYWKSGLQEMVRSVKKSRFVADVQRLVPVLQAEDFVDWHSGIRAQALTPDGSLADDFVIVTTENAVHVLNAPSPAATAALAIGEHIGEVVRRGLG